MLGLRLRSEVGDEVAEVVITEVEAYAGLEDPAAHAYRGPTLRNASMFEEPGSLYVYRSYGIHWCANVVTGPPERGEAVLLRGGEPSAGIEVMRRRRGRPDHLADGPGKLAQALGITGVLDGTSVLDGPVRLLEGPALDATILATPRIGITKAVERPWRFVLIPS